MAAVYWFADGVGDVGEASTAMVRWIRTQGPALIVYGGDVYGHGTSEQFDRFLEQMDHDVSDMCEVAGNHDWETTTSGRHPDKTPVNYEAFWGSMAPPLSQQPIDTSRRGGARYDHVRDLEGWRLIFVDTGPCNDSVWPVGDESRRDWLRSRIAETPTRAKIVFAHHSRLSKGKHGDIKNVDPLWRCLFEPVTAAPLVAMTIAGHDHNVSVYGPRPMANPGHQAVPFARGVYAVVNGAGGYGHDVSRSGSTPEFQNDDDFCLTKIDLLSPTAADVSILSFGPNSPPTLATPVVLNTVQIRL